MNYSPGRSRPKFGTYTLDCERSPDMTVRAIGQYSATTGSSLDRRTQNPRRFTQPVGHGRRIGDLKGHVFDFHDIFLIMALPTRSVSDMSPITDWFPSNCLQADDI